MYSDHQLELLRRSRRWFVDGTFKVVKFPFTQLWSIHAFARVDDKVKQLPLVYVLMSGKRRQDYRSILRSIKEILEENNARDHAWRVESVVADFETAVWTAFSSEFPGMEMRGCGFHWSQAVWRKMQELGMQSAYNNDPATNQYCRQILALSCLPAEHIEGALNELREEAVSIEQRNVLNYIQRTWIDSTLWPPSTWSIFYRSIRTNNDVEGWHRRLNAKASRGNLNMYLLMSLLSKEASLVEVELQLLRESAISRRQRNDKNTKRLFAAWDKLIANERTARQTLRTASHVLPMPIEER